MSSITTPEGFVLTVHHSLYMDYGLSITRGGRELFYSPCCLSNESYGRKPNPDKYDDWDEAERAELDGDDEAFVEWTDSDWRQALQSEADDLIEAFVTPKLFEDDRIRIDYPIQVHTLASPTEPVFVPAGLIATVRTDCDQDWCSAGRMALMLVLDDPSVLPDRLIHANIERDEPPGAVYTWHDTWDSFTVLDKE